jgi:ABC-type transport system involved in cytochrome bd biosynthesis fused ATPase/permease subunit
VACSRPISRATWRWTRWIASLDAISTEQIKASLDAVKVGRTVLIISHNISQIMDADHIYVIREGHVAAEGTHETLYRDGGLHREIIDSNARTLNIGRLAATVLGSELAVAG